MSTVDSHDRRRYLMRHALEGQQVLSAVVLWNGKNWTVKVNGDVLPDCCDTLEDAFTVAEAEVTRRAPGHTCAECRQWHPFDEDAGA